MKDKNKTTKLIPALLIILILIPTILFSAPKKADAFWGFGDISWDSFVGFFTGSTAGSSAANAGTNLSSLGLKIKDVAKEVLRQTAMAVARRALQEMTKSTVNWINDGFHGQPLFLENPDSFFKDIAKSEVKSMVDQFGYDSLKYPFGRDFALNAINSYKRTLEDNASYSLSKVISDPATLYGYQNDFNVGGWNAFLINTQYPQNNYVGFQMTATEELARRVQGTAKTAVGKVNDALAQGQGFLSPETCADNGGDNEYNKVAANAWNRPSFNEAEYIKNNKLPDCDASTDSCKQEVDNWENALATARANWANEKNTCKNLVNTTPGAVVANQITTSLNIPMNSTLQAMGLGNSISMIFDALLNKFIGDGLNSLASKINPKEEEPDTWSYDGQTLGSPGNIATGNNWDIGPEEPIYINKFMKDIVDGITNTEAELDLMSQITDNLSTIWPKSQTLDRCLPGPDVGWGGRLEDERTKYDKKIQSATSDENDAKVAEGEKVSKELKIAVDFFKDWIMNKMMGELPSSILFIDAVKNVEALSQESNELTDARRIKAQGLARLEAIKTSLDEIVTLDDKGKIVQPEVGSFEEEILIQLKKEYDSTKISISNVININDRQNELLTTQDQKEKLDKLITKCTEERKENGYPAVTTGSAFSPEQAAFCDLPVIGGYTHGAFQGLSLTHPELPMLNARKVLKYKVLTIKSVLFPSFSGSIYKTSYISIGFNCNTIYNASVLDYKGNLPGSINTETYTESNGNPVYEVPLGSCEFDDGVDTNIEEDVTEEYCNDNAGNWTQNEEVTP